MAGHSVNLQDGFLNQVRKENVSVEVTLLSGERLQGMVKGFDNFTLIMQVDNMQHLVYKHAIAQLIAPKMTPRSSGTNRDDRDHGSNRRPQQSDNRDSGKFNAMDLSQVQVKDKG